MSEKNDPVRVALVGLGGHGRTIQDAAASATNLTVAAVCDVVEPELSASAGRFNCDAAPSFDALLDRQDLEAVVLVTPNHLHRMQAEAAIAAGLDVFVEKPITSTVEDGLALAASAHASGRLVMVGHNMRFARATQKAREFLADGRLGRIVSIEIHFSSDGARHLQTGAWRLRPDQCPLLPVMQLGIHAIDLVQFLISPIRNVFAVARSVITSGEVVDSVTAALEFDTGATGTLVSNYCTPLRFEYRITGTDGTMECTPHTCRFRSAADTDVRGAGPVEVHDFSEFDGESYVRQMEAFGRSVRTRMRPEIDAMDGVRALAVVEALQRSADEQTPQRVRTFAEQRDATTPHPFIQESS